MAHDWQPDFEQLVDEHQSMVFSLALRMTGDRGLAEEIAQDVFLELDRRLGKIESADHARFWLRRVAMSRSVDAQRAALVLRYQEDLTPEEIAATLGSPLATVKSHLQRGLKLLRAKAQSHLKEYVRVKEQASGA
jgi:RNA polymerase sigma-70 factor (ECF subfamily)